LMFDTELKIRDDYAYGKLFEGKELLQKK